MDEDIIKAYQLPFPGHRDNQRERSNARSSEASRNLSLFEVYEGKEGQTFADGWRNKLSLMETCLSG